MRYFNAFLIVVLIFGIAACNQPAGKSNNDNGKLNVVTTTTMITDLMKQIGGDKINVQGLMGAGVDPHLYKATESDVTKLYKADLIIYNGLHLEGKLDDILDKMNQGKQKTYAIGDAIPRDRLLKANNEYSHFDPHIWFDIQNWKLAADYAAKILQDADEKNAEVYQSNLEKYQAELDDLENMVTEQINTIPKDKQVLITAHDAFEYFGRSYGFEVKGLQGISTVSEAGAADVRNLADFIFERKIPAIFVESSVPVRNIRALQDAVNARGFEVKIGGELYSDALGTPGTLEGTYIGMYEHNVNTIASALNAE
jgi:manganese/zinc/iron transport system substrate-binding protein